MPGAVEVEIHRTLSVNTSQAHRYINRSDDVARARRVANDLVREQSDVAGIVERPS
jgi:hypothetical protein